jgi:hypothetical protein
MIPPALAVKKPISFLAFQAFDPQLTPFFLIFAEDISQIA